jgi:hypothetical protein
MVAWAPALEGEDGTELGEVRCAQTPVTAASGDGYPAT